MDRFYTDNNSNLPFYDEDNLYHNDSFGNLLNELANGRFMSELYSSDFKYLYDSLSKIQRAILDSRIDGDTNKEIAIKLGKTEKYIGRQVDRIKKRFLGGIA